MSEVARWLGENWLSLLALVVAVIAVVPAFRANRYTRDQIALIREVHDVRWDWTWVQPGLLRLENESSACAAYNVRALVQVDSEKVRTYAVVVFPEGELFLEFPGANAAYWREVKKAQAAGETPVLDASTFVKNFISTKAMTGTAREVMMSRKVGFRVDWVTDRGTPRSQEEKVERVALGHPDEV